MITSYGLFQDPIVVVYEGDVIRLRLEWVSSVPVVSYQINVDWGDGISSVETAGSSPLYLEHRAAGGAAYRDIVATIFDGVNPVVVVSLRLYITNLPPSFCDDSYEDMIQAAVPYGYWRLNELLGTEAENIAAQYGTASIYDGTYSGTFTLGLPGAIISDSTSDAAVSFDGATGYLDLHGLYAFGSMVGAPYGLPAGTHGSFGLTIEMWVKFNASIANTPLFAATSTSQSVIFGVDANNKLYLHITLGVFSNITEAAFSNTSLGDGQWHHLVATWSRVINPALGQATNISTIYADGVKVNTWSLLTNIPDLPIQLDDFIDAYLARYNTLYANAIFDELAIYARPMATREVQLHYTRGLRAGKMLWAQLDNNTGDVDLQFGVCDPGVSVAFQAGEFIQSPVESYSVVINWGDGASTTINLTDPNIKSAGGYGEVHHTYTSYAADASYARIISVVLCDGDDCITDVICPNTTYYNNIIDYAYGVVNSSSAITYYDTICQDGGLAGLYSFDLDELYALGLDQLYYTDTSGCYGTIAIGYMYVDAIPFYILTADNIATGGMDASAIADYTSVLILKEDIQCRRVGMIPFETLVSP